MVAAYPSQYDIACMSQYDIACMSEYDIACCLPILRANSIGLRALDLGHVDMATAVTHLTRLYLLRPCASYTSRLCVHGAR